MKNSNNNYANCSLCKDTQSSSPKEPRAPFYNLFSGCRSLPGEMSRTVNEGCEFRPKQRRSTQPVHDVMIARYQHAFGDDDSIP
jgi:hypothetical protein